MNTSDNNIAQARRRLIRTPFVRLMISGFFVLIATCACGFIDNLFIGRLLGTEALAAVGFFSPVSTAVQLSNVLVFGTMVLSSNYIGEGRWDRVNRLFYTAFLALFGLFFAFSLGCFLLRDPLAELLGAAGETARLLSDYIAGFAFGIAPQALAALLMALASFNNDLRRSYLGTGAMIIGNIVGDWLLTARMGLFGVGLTSALSSLAAFLILLPGFLSKDKVFHLDKKAGLDFGLLGRAMARGLPSLMFTLGLIVKNSLFNHTLSTFTGDDGVAVANVMFTVCAVLGAIPGGCGNAFSSLAGLYYGEEDRASFLELVRIALRIGLSLCAAGVLLLMLLSRPVASLFFARGSSAWPMARRMLLLGFLFLIPNLVFNILLKAYHAQGRTLLMNILSAAETASVGLFAALTVPRFGADAAWLANAIVDVACLIVILISVVHWRKRLDFSLPSLLKLPDRFGASEQELLEFSVSSLQEVSSASQQTIAFCEQKGYPKRTAFYVGLCVEEMASNVLSHGFGSGGRYSVDLRIVARDELTVRIRDNCMAFDPRKRLDLFNPDSPEQNIGIRITAKLAKQIDYYNNAGINTLLMKF